MGEKSITVRDIVHNTGFEFSGVLRELLDTPAMGRLHGIKQLGLAYLTFPGAQHTRYAHSVGATGIGAQALEALSKHVTISDRDKTLVQIRLLLHDIGHYPFSHLSERTSASVDHEEHSRKLILGETTLPIVGDPQIAATLNKYGFSGEEILATPQEGNYPQFYADLVSSKLLDMDRMDYLARDSYHTGAKIGSIDVNRILETIVVDPTGTLGVEYRGVDNIEQFLWARAKMHSGIYHHEDARIADAMMLEAMRLSIVDPTKFYDDAHLKSYLLTSSPSEAKALLLRLERGRDALYDTALKIEKGNSNHELSGALYHLKNQEEEEPGAFEHHLRRDTGLTRGQVIVVMASEKPFKNPPRFPVKLEDGSWEDLFKVSDDVARVYAKGNLQDPFAVYCAKEHVDRVQQVAKELLYSIA